ncbi:MAG: hypothetical protein QF893_12330 [Alphaproteobacteria bacterium]|jgi:hypothetical protein|nr:hypothetical protein [Alphaproteobacteria bacterium]
MTRCTEKLYPDHSIAWRRHGAITFLLGLILTGAMLTSNAGWASSLKVEVGSGAHGGGPHYGSPYGHRRHHPGLSFFYGYSKHGAHRRHRRHHGPSAGHHGTGYAPKPAYGCRAVTKKGYDAYGQPALIGGTLCQDAYGRSYIVDGSRHVIHRY